MGGGRQEGMSYLLATTNLRVGFVLEVEEVNCFPLEHFTVLRGNQSFHFCLRAHTHTHTHIKKGFILVFYIKREKEMFYNGQCRKDVATLQYVKCIQ